MGQLMQESDINNGWSIAPVRSRVGPTNGSGPTQDVRGELGADAPKQRRRIRSVVGNVTHMTRFEDRKADVHTDRTGAPSDPHQAALSFLPDINLSCGMFSPC